MGFGRFEGPSAGEGDRKLQGQVVELGETSRVFVYGAGRFHGPYVGGWGYSMTHVKVEGIQGPISGRGELDGVEKFQGPFVGRVGRFQGLYECGGMYHRSISEWVGNGKILVPCVGRTWY